ncbi:inositol monophosphatase family protein [Candidatus Peribacteria bacterium]|jgi:myo-inositol-1(or 4)-monophosphatase|nr:inositol monophosphatase family protein [Candidatus Peribacteria bacterium]MBT4021128.1 inositol monophosphatase family protein [Candidatus Peribacteria bacterium]MBT4240716.1 inositol monophosphatase family protein [Candidatus Peribacteria bacterium]MBT4474380.1 inositol monophosphatase family protein [Candidatus Peribacteria bacterium]
MIDLNKTLEIAIKIAEKAGDFVMKHHGTDLDIKTKKTENDLVTEIDKESQRIIISAIKEEFSDHGFIGEEASEENKLSESPYEWIIDPIDGTINFVRAREDFGINIALQEDGNLILGIMYLPMLNQMFTATKDGGAFLNGNPIKLRNTKNMMDAILCSNLTKRAKKDSNGILQISTPACASLHNYGCAAQEIARILLGHNDGVFFDGVGLWDVAPGALMVKEAGGDYFIDYENPGDVKCVASTSAIFEELKLFLEQSEMTA